MADFDIFAGDFPFTDFSNNFGPNHILDPSLQGMSQPQPTHYQIPHNFASPTSALSPISGYDQATKKRKLDTVAPVIQQQQSLDESARNAAEEDKRRRNTAASARFRVKKKQREATLEKTAKEMSDRATRLEQKVQQLETENAWLKSLITEKSGNPSNDLKKLLSKREEAVASRSSAGNTDGVGTDA